VKIIGIFFICSFLTGCASTASIWLESTSENPCERRNRIYGGAKLDAKLIYDSFVKKDVSMWLGVPGVIDIVPSAVFDTIQLPFTIPATQKQIEACEKEKIDQNV
jgi:uncharacterized protein YceK